MNYLIVFFIYFSFQFSIYYSVAFRGIKQRQMFHASASHRNRTFDPTKVIQLSWHPRAFLYKGFLSDEECDHLINMAKGKLQRSMVVDDKTGNSLLSDVRTSTDMSLRRAQDDIVANIEARIAAWTLIPEEHGEELLILRYKLNQYYAPHYDAFVDELNIQLGGNRIATVLMYLSDVVKGGETIFPLAEAKMSQLKDETWSDCANKGYAVKARKGDALLFFNLHPNGTTDISSEHGSCPVIAGEKWSATKWIHTVPLYETWEKK